VKNFEPASTRDQSLDTINWAVFIPETMELETHHGKWFKDLFYFKVIFIE
jgi:hypothetical protein